MPILCLKILKQQLYFDKYIFCASDIALSTMDMQALWKTTVQMMLNMAVDFEYSNSVNC